MKKRLTAFLLLVVMIVVFVACGETNTPASTDAPETETKATETSATETSATESTSVETNATESEATETSSDETAETEATMPEETETTGGSGDEPPVVERSDMFDERNN